MAPKDIIFQGTIDQTCDERVFLDFVDHSWADAGPQLISKEMIHAMGHFVVCVRASTRVVVTFVARRFLTMTLHWPQLARGVRSLTRLRKNALTKNEAILEMVVWMLNEVSPKKSESRHSVKAACSHIRSLRSHRRSACKAVVQQPH